MTFNLFVRNHFGRFRLRGLLLLIPSGKRYEPWIHLAELINSERNIRNDASFTLQMTVD